MVLIRDERLLFSISTLHRCIKSYKYLKYLNRVTTFENGKNHTGFKNIRVSIEASSIKPIKIRNYHFKNRFSWQAKSAVRSRLLHLNIDRSEINVDVFFIQCCDSEKLMLGTWRLFFFYHYSRRYHRITNIRRPSGSIEAVNEFHRVKMRPNA